MRQLSRRRYATRPSRADAHAATPNATTHIAVRTTTGPRTTVKTDAAAPSGEGDARLRVGHWRRGEGVRRHTRQPQEKRCNQNRRISHILISQLAAVRCGPVQNSLRLNSSQPNAKTYCPSRRQNARGGAAFLMRMRISLHFLRLSPSCMARLAPRHCLFTPPGSERRYANAAGSGQPDEFLRRRCKAANGLLAFGAHSCSRRTGSIMRARARRRSRSRRSSSSSFFVVVGLITIMIKPIFPDKIQMNCG
jgi:hypothetical protein